ncbi:MAG: hypothetical protein AAF747_10640 [Planctomycetota bacterium]
MKIRSLSMAAVAACAVSSASAQLAADPDGADFFFNTGNVTNGFITEFPLWSATDVAIDDIGLFGSGTGTINVVTMTPTSTIMTLPQLYLRAWDGDNGDGTRRFIVQMSTSPDGILGNATIPIAQPGEVAGGGSNDLFGGMGLPAFQGAFDNTGELGFIARVVESDGDFFILFPGLGFGGVGFTPYEAGTFIDGIGFGNGFSTVSGGDVFDPAEAAALFGNPPPAPQAFPVGYQAFVEYEPCPEVPDVNGDELVDVADVIDFQALFNIESVCANLEPDGQLNYYDYVAYFDSTEEG